MLKKIKTNMALMLILAFILTATGCQSNTGTSDITTISESSTDKSQDTTNESVEKNPLTIANITLSHVGGFYDSGFTLELSATDASEIYYTTDGSSPSESETAILYTNGIEIKDRSADKNVLSAVEPDLFSANFSEYDRDAKAYVCSLPVPQDSDVDKCSVIKIASKNSDGSFSDTITETYFVGSTEQHINGITESCQAANGSLAVISISMDYDDLFDAETGIYVKGNVYKNAWEESIAAGIIPDDTARKLPANYNQRGSDWERSAHVDFFEADAKGATEVISQDCGIRIQGNYSRSDLLKSFRLLAKSEYGDNNFKYEVFGNDLQNSNGETIDKFKTLVLRAGGNCTFDAKFNDTYWQTIARDMNCSTQRSRPCVVYLNGEYWGLYVLEEDYSNDYFEDHYNVNKDDVVVYKGDAETYPELGYKLDEGKLPEGENDESYYFNELNNFFKTHKNLENDADLAEFEKLVDIDSVIDYFAAEVWINNKWDWPGKNWSMWKTANITDDAYGDGRWRFCFYDMEFGGVSGEGDAYTNTVKEDNYQKYGLLDTATKNPAVLCYAYLMSNPDIREKYCNRLQTLSDNAFSQENTLKTLEWYENVYSPLYEQFFNRFPETGSADEALHDDYASSDCIRQFIEAPREKYISKIVDWINKHFE